MGLISNILISVVHLALCVADVLFVIIVLQIVHNRWQIHWMEPILTAVRPLMSALLNWFHPLILRVTGKSYSERTLLVLLVICLSVIRFLVVSIFGWFWKGRTATMEYKFNTIILLLVFTILLVIIFRTFKDSHQFGSISSLILSVCVSALATIGLNSNIKGMMGAILVPYAALAICILSVVLIAFLFNSNNKVKKQVFRHIQK